MLSQWVRPLVSKEIRLIPGSEENALSISVDGGSVPAVVHAPENVKSRMPSEGRVNANVHDVAALFFTFPINQRC